jgi:hypothetical protein
MLNHASSKEVMLAGSVVINSIEVIGTLFVNLCRSRIFDIFLILIRLG